MGARVKRIGEKSKRGNPQWSEILSEVSMVFSFKNCSDLGGFQLLDLIIPELKSHVIPYKFKCSHWWKIHL